MKKRIYHILNKDDRFIKFINAFIILNVIALILESYEGLRDPYDSLFYGFEVFSVILFTIEYILRVWSADVDESYDGSQIRKRINFTTSAYGLIDLIAILPFYLPMIFPFDLRVVRILRLFRLLRIFKLSRFSKSFNTIYSVLRDTKSDLAITAFVAFVLLVLSSTLMYYIEGEAQPDKFASIGHAFWWSVATLTTVGYGDVYPITGFGKFLSGIIALIGIGFIALPTGILSSAFAERLRKQKESISKDTHQCPNCGTKF